jgi:aminomethyltransferase
MPTGTPFHPRTEPLCHSHAWRHWSGYVVATSYNDFVQPEYAAIRHAAALIDVSPLYKYSIEGPDAEALVDRVITHDAAKMPPGRIVYTPWCDPDGSVRQEGTVFRLGEREFLQCAAEPTYAWLKLNARGLDVAIADRSTDIAALSLQGPASRTVLAEVATGAPVETLEFFHWCEGEIAGVPVTLSRTGYTGDLGYEIWSPRDRALRVWDALTEGGRPHHLTPCGLAAMDVARVEAGFVLLNVDYISSEVALLPAHKATPYELGLGWAVKLDKSRRCVGHAPLAAEKERGPRRKVVGIEIDWQPLEDLHLEAGLMPDLPLLPSREPVPVYAAGGGPQIGRVTTRVWSQLLKKYIGLATLDGEHAAAGSRVDMEVTVDFVRRRAPARVVKTPFFRPERMRA